MPTRNAPMKTGIVNIWNASLTLALAAGLLAGCATTTEPPPPGTKTATISSTRPGSGPRAPEYNETSSYFPTGVQAGSGLLLTIRTPREAYTGQPATYEIVVQNVTQSALRDVTVQDAVGENFTVSAATPETASNEGNRLRWNLGALAAGQSTTLTVTGSAKDEGAVEHCANASYSLVVCDNIHVVKASVALVKTLPEIAMVCDPIPLHFTVTNTGTAHLTGVHLADTLPAGLTAPDGAAAYNQDIGALDPGQSREFTVNLHASHAGQYANTATVTSTQGVNAEASAEVKVVQPELTLTCASPEQAYAGRPIPVCLTVKNVSDAASAATTVELTLPTDATVQSSTAGGTTQGNKVTWNVGALGAGDSRELCATITAATMSNQPFSAVAKGSCATEVTTACSTRVTGVAALLLEMVDTNDPIEVGGTEVYVITVTNQGSADATNIRVVAQLEDTQSFVSATGASSANASGRTVTFDPVPTLAAKAVATWRVTVKAEAAGDVRFKVTMNANELQRSVDKTESTRQY